MSTASFLNKTESYADDSIREAHGGVFVERVLTVFDNRTDQMTAEYPLRSFDLEKFKQRFAVDDTADPSMFDVYPVSQTEADFISAHLEELVIFDFDHNLYFIECSTAE